MALTWAAGEKMTAAKMNARLPLYVSKAAGAQSVTSSTAFVDDTALQLTLLPSRTYNVRCVLSVEGAQAGDIKLQWSLGAGLTMSIERAARGPSINSTDVTGGAAAATTACVNRASSSHTSGTTNSYGTDGANASDVVEEFEITTAASGSMLLKLQWAQRASNATPTVVGVDSYLLATPVS